MIILRINFSISPYQHMLWILIKAHRRGASNEYPEHMFYGDIRNIIPLRLPDLLNKSCGLADRLSVAVN